MYLTRFVNKTKIKKVILLLFFFPIRLFFYIFFKPRVNQILFISFDGLTYSCNPKAIYDFIIKNHPNEFQLFWAFRKDFDFNSLPTHVNAVKVGTIKYYKILTTSNFLISNTRLSPLNRKWKNKPRYYIQTWHGTALKKIERDAMTTLPKHWIKMAQKDSKLCNLMISGSKYHTSTIRNAMWYKGEILEIGTPRNDIFFITNNSIRNNFDLNFGTKPNQKLVLYAPTFRLNYYKNTYFLDPEILIHSLKYKFGGEWKLLVRFHPNLLNKNYKELFNFTHNSVIDVTKYNDMHELLYISDILITDVSSSIFDFSILKRPCFLYMNDLETYERGYYFDFHKLPFELCKTFDDLNLAILKFNYNEYLNKLNLFNNELGTCEKGNSSEQIIKWIKEKVF